MMRPRYRLRTRLYSSDLTANHLAVTNTVMSTNSAAKGGGICLLNDTKRGLMETNFSNTIITENTATERFMFIGTQCDLWGRPDGTGKQGTDREIKLSTHKDNINDRLEQCQITGRDLW